MKNIRNKFIGFFINLLFSLIWFIVSIYIWDYVDAWLEYKNSFSISGFDECKKFISKIKPDGILTFDNFWMDYCLSDGINCLVVQRIKFTRRYFYCL